MSQSQPASSGTYAIKKSQEEIDRALAEKLHKQLNDETPHQPPGGSASLDEEEGDLYGDNRYHSYEDSKLDCSCDEELAAILQTQTIVPGGQSFSDPKTDSVIAFKLQTDEIKTACCSDSQLAKEIAKQDTSTVCDTDRHLAKEIANQDISNQLQEDEEMARSLSQAESQEQHRQPALPLYPCGQDMVEDLFDPLAQLVLGMAGNNNCSHHRWRQGRGNRHWHGSRHGRHHGGEEHEVDEGNYEELLELEEMIGDAEGQGLNSEQLDMLPVSKYTSSSSEENECKVCFSKFENGETVRTLPCCHLFHQECIDGWIKDHNSCPICRKGIREELHD